jgi:hypothetical protein
MVAVILGFGIIILMTYFFFLSGDHRKEDWASRVE